MSTRFYLSYLELTEPGLTPTADAGWTRAVDMARYRLEATPGDAFAAQRVLWSNLSVGANASTCIGQFVSVPLATGTAFTTSDTLKGVTRVTEYNSGANINRQPICAKIVSRDGTLVRATLLPLAHYGPSTSEYSVLPTMTNRQFSAGSALQANYTTQAGDRLLIEIGGQVDGTGSATAGGGMFIGAAIGGTDLAENETDTGDPTSNRVWMEFSNTITWAPPVGDDASGCLLTLVQALTGGEALF